MKTLQQRREGITPVIATVILIAVTLIAAVAVTGFTFGLFGSFTSSPLVTVIGSSLSASGLTGSTGTVLTAACATTSSASYIQLGNTGTSSIAVTGGTIVYGGSTIPLSLDASCSGVGQVAVAPGGSFYLQLSASPKLSTAATAGDNFIMNVVLANGVTIPAAGTFVA
jgi:flagellin-like protein